TSGPASKLVVVVNDSAAAEFLTLSLHDALPICRTPPAARQGPRPRHAAPRAGLGCRHPRRPRGRGAGLRPHAGRGAVARSADPRSEEHTSELQSRENIVCRLLLEKKNQSHTEP